MNKKLIFYLVSLIGTFSGIYAMQEEFDKNLHEETRKIFSHFKKASAPIPVEEQIAALSPTQDYQRQKLMNTAHKNFFTTLYECRSLIHISKPEEEFSNKDNPELLKKIFEKNCLATQAQWLKTKKPWSDKDWAIARKALASNTESHCTIKMEQSCALLQSARSLLKSFVPLDNKFNPNDKDINKHFINKGIGLARLYTYNKLQQTIEAKKLSHVHLPLKFLAIKDLRTNTYITGRKALKMMDDLMVIYIHHPGSMDGEVIMNSNDFDCALFAHRQERGGRPLNENTMKELEILITETPFDVGYDNIFSDENGDAVIIDTEFKGEGSDTCILKLRARYWHK